MTALNRRNFGKLAGAAGLAISLAPTRFAIAQGAGRVVVIGGGAGGASVANMLKREAAKLDVTLIEVNRTYSSSFFSNLYLGGLRPFASLNHDYGLLTKMGVKVVYDRASEVDTARKVVKTRGGQSFPYDRLVLSPGIDMKLDAIAGYDAEAVRVMPHAYNTDGAQKRLLKRQLDAMRDGGTVVLAPPANPYRCPPGPYERACMIAHYLKTRKPKSKLVILDPKKTFSKQPVFTEAFDKYYKGIIELNLSNDIDDFAIARVDLKSREIATKAGKTVKADVANIIPPHRAGEIARVAGLVDGDWCPIDPVNFASKKAADVYVIGDAAIAAEMPKSAFSASSQGKAVAEDILAALAAKEKFAPRYRNTCWSMVAPDDCVKIGASYAPKDGKLEPSQSFVSQRSEYPWERKNNVTEANGWYQSITTEMFAKGGARKA